MRKENGRPARREIPDESLVARYADGEAEAFDELSRRYEPRACSFFLERTGSPERPDQHFLTWWSATAVGGRLVGAGGLALGALCFGAVSALAFGAGAAFLGLGAKGEPRLAPLLSAAMLLALLAPGLALQSIGTSWAVFFGWLAGTGAGAYAGVAGGDSLRSFLSSTLRRRR